MNNAQSSYMREWLRNCSYANKEQTQEFMKIFESQKQEFEQLSQ